MSPPDSSEGARLATDRPVTANTATAKPRDSEPSYGAHLADAVNGPCLCEPAARAPWLRALRRDLYLSDGTKLILTVVGERMDPAGTVKYSRDALALETGRGTRSIQRHLVAAAERGWLQRVRGGHNGATSIYQASMPQQASRETRRETSWETPTSTLRVSLPSVSASPSRETAVVSLNRHGARSDHGALDGAAADDPTTAQPRPTATSKGANDGEGQQGSRSTPEPLAPDVALATARPPARRSAPTALEVSRACAYCGQAFAPIRDTQIAHPGRCPVPVKVTTKSGADRERPSDPPTTAPSLAVVLAFGPVAARRECLACTWGQGQHAAYCEAVA